MVLYLNTRALVVKQIAPYMAILYKPFWLDFCLLFIHKWYLNMYLKKWLPRVKVFSQTSNPNTKSFLSTKIIRMISTVWQLVCVCNTMNLKCEGINHQVPFDIDHVIPISYKIICWVYRLRDNLIYNKWYWYDI